jgi:2-methylcitrate dehydratase
VAKALGLSPLQTANAIAIAGTANNALRVTRTGALSHWKGLAYPNTVFSATHATFLALRGVTGIVRVSNKESWCADEPFASALQGRAL